MLAIISEIAVWAICLLVGICMMSVGMSMAKHEGTDKALNATAMAFLLLIALIIIARYGRFA
jgi:hypothetical protein